MYYKVNLSYLGSSLGYSLSLFFIPLIVFYITDSSLMVSIAYALDVIPYIVITPIIGVIGDRYNKKHIILIGELFCFLVSATLYFIPYNSDYIYGIMLLGFLLSIFSAIHHPIFQSILPELFHSDELIKLNGDIASITSLTGIIAPTIVGIVFPIVSKETIPLLMVVCYVLSISSFININYKHIRYESVGFYKELNSGINFVKNEFILKNLSFLFFFANFGLRLVFVSLIWIYSSKYDMNETSIAIIFSCIGLSSMLGAKVASKFIINKFSDINIIIFSLIVISLLTLSNLLFSSYILLTISWCGVSFLSMFIVVTYFTYRQKVTPKNMLGKVISITRLISYLAIPPAAILAGYLTSKYQNENMIYMISGIIMLVSAILFYFTLTSKKNIRSNTR